MHAGIPSCYIDKISKMQEMLVGLQVAIMLLSVQNITYRSSSGLRIRESLNAMHAGVPSCNIDKTSKLEELLVGFK